MVDFHGRQAVVVRVPHSGAGKEMGECGGGACVSVERDRAVGVWPGCCWGAAEQRAGVGGGRGEDAAGRPKITV